MNENALIEIFVEVPKGSRNKYEYDHQAGCFRLDRMLFSAVHYPGDYGYIPATLAEDGDPLDALVILREPTFPGCLITGRVVGVLHMRDEEGPDAKILAVPTDDPRWEHVQDFPDVPNHLSEEIRHFFAIYKDLEGKRVDIQGWKGRNDALAEVEASRRRFRST